MKITSLTAILMLIIFTFIGSSCKKLDQVDAPYTSINADNIYTNNATAASVLTGIYTTLSKSNSSGFNNGGVSSLSFFRLYLRMN